MLTQISSYPNLLFNFDDFIIIKFLTTKTISMNHIKSSDTVLFFDFVGIEHLFQ